MPDRPPYDQLPEKAQLLMQAIATTYFDQTGWPPMMSKEEAMQAFYKLVETGVLRINYREGAEGDDAFHIELE